MKRIIFMIALLLIVTSVQAGIIWNFDSPTYSPITVTKFGGGIYVYTASTVAGKGIGGTSALSIHIIPYSSRSWGVGFNLMPSATLNLSTTPLLYSWIAADSTNTFGVANDVFSGGSKFIPQMAIGGAGDAQQFAGTISSTFQKVQFDLRTFHQYNGVDTTGAAPALNAISNIEWIFPDNTTATNQGFNFFLDNVGAAAAPASVNDWSIYSIKD